MEHNVMELSTCIWQFGLTVPGPKWSKINRICIFFCLYLTTNTSEGFFIEHKSVGIFILFSWHIQIYKYYRCNPTSCSSWVRGTFRATAGTIRELSLLEGTSTWPPRLEVRQMGLYTIPILHAQTLMGARSCRSCKGMRNRVMHINKRPRSLS